MSGDFFDSNTVVYMFDDIDLRKRDISTNLIDEALENQSGVISFQVVQETLNIVTKVIPNPVASDRAQFLLDNVLMPLWRVMPSQRLYEQALQIRGRYRYAFYDSLIIAAALEAGCSRLYSEDLQHGQVIESLRIENPFRTL